MTCQKLINKWDFKSFDWFTRLEAHQGNMAQVQGWALTPMYWACYWWHQPTWCTVYILEYLASCGSNYNIPPWEATKKGNILLSLLVLGGKHKVKNMDVYLEPLIEELQDLWRGVEVMDVSRPPKKQCAIIKCIMLWTLHDYPRLGELSSIHNFYLEKTKLHEV